jgi:GntR family transcriptional regulator, transcriptional repressor for pyruvate dehydrogenase complex
MDSIKPVKLADVIIERIETMILEGVIRPGEKLVAERDLAEKLGVSRPSLRDALDRLEAKGLLNTTRSGTHVAQILKPFSDPLSELFNADQRVTADYFEYRMIMEANAARLAALRLTDVDRDAINACMIDMHKAHLAQDSRDEAETDARLHLLVYEAAHNVVLLHIMRVISNMLRQDVFYNRERLYARSGVRDTLLEQHIEIANSILAGDAHRAETAASTHIKYVFNTIEEIRRDELRQSASQRRIDRDDLVVG